MRRATLLATALLLVTGTAHAQPVDPGRLVKEGIELRRSHRDADALDVFRRAYALAPSPRTLAQIALAEQALGRFVDAESDLQAAIASGADPWIRRSVGALEAGLADIRTHLGWLELAADVPRASVSVNGVELGEKSFPLRLRVEGGSVVVEVRAPGFAPSRRITSVEPGGTARENVPLVALGAPATLPDDAGAARSPPPGPTGPPRVVSPVTPGTREVRVVGDRALRRSGWVALGSGVVGLGLGAYFGARTLATKSQRDRYCTGLTCQPRGIALDEQARSLATRSTAWIVAGGLAGATGGVLLWLSRSHEVRIEAEVGADRAEAVVGGRW
jgi:serine/threonine-protein kinase